jgi:hypothetical protein
MSIADIGSLATTSNMSPGTMASSALRAFKTGNGHSNPVKSNVVFGWLSNMASRYSGLPTLEQEMSLLTKLSFTGNVDSLLLRPLRDGGFEKAPHGNMQLAFSGPVGDCHRGELRKSDSRTLALHKRGIDIRNVRQVTIVSREELAALAQRLEVPHIEASWIGANIVAAFHTPAVSVSRHTCGRHGKPALFANCRIRWCSLPASEATAGQTGDA